MLKLFRCIKYCKYADMAELADAHGSGPCESNFMQVQVLLSAPKSAKLKCFADFIIVTS